MTEDRDRLNVESTDIVWIVNKRKKSERYSPIDCRTSDPQRFSLAQFRILQPYYILWKSNFHNLT